MITVLVFKKCVTFFMSAPSGSCKAAVTLKRRVPAIEKKNIDNNGKKSLANRWHSRFKNKTHRVNVIIVGAI